MFVLLAQARERDRLDEPARQTGPASDLKSQADMAAEAAQQAAAELGTWEAVEAARAASAAEQAARFTMQQETLQELRLIGKKVHCLEARLEPGRDRLVRNLLNAQGFADLGAFSCMAVFL